MQMSEKGCAWAGACKAPITANANREAYLHALLVKELR